MYKMYIYMFKERIIHLLYKFYITVQSFFQVKL